MNDGDAIERLSPAALSLFLVSGLYSLMKKFVISLICVAFVIGIARGQASSPVEGFAVKTGNIFDYYNKVHYQMIMHKGQKYYPLVIIMHGTSSNRYYRKELNPFWYANLEWKFAELGYAVVFFERPGFGASGGSRINSGLFNACIGNCAKVASVDDAKLAQPVIQHFEKAKWFNKQIIIIGHSSGGMAALALASQNIKYVKAVINFSGGWSVDKDDHLRKKLFHLDVKTSKNFGQKIKIPSLWIYVRNDKIIPKQIATEMFSAFSKYNSDGKLVILPSFGKNGHYLVQVARPRRWFGKVSIFLKKIKMPFSDRYKIMDSQKIAALIKNVPKIYWNAAFHYLTLINFNKAMAIGSRGYGISVGQDSQEKANEVAVSYCKKIRKNHQCTILFFSNSEIDNNPPVIPSVINEIDKENFLGTPHKAMTDDFAAIGR